MKLKKICAIAATAAMAMGLLTGCGSTAATSEAANDAVASSTSSASSTDGEKFTVGICQLVQHPALDAATEGFKDALKAEFGDNVTFDEQNAAGDASTATQICTNFASENVDLILANATASLQSAAAATNTIPILGTSITEYGVALEIDDFDGTVGGNISGTSDLAPLDQQAAMIQELFPDAKNVGILYCSAEPNSKYQAEQVLKKLVLQLRFTHSLIQTMLLL